MKVSSWRGNLKHDSSLKANVVLSHQLVVVVQNYEHRRWFYIQMYQILQKDCSNWSMHRDIWRWILMNSICWILGCAQWCCRHCFHCNSRLEFPLKKNIYWLLFLSLFIFFKTILIPTGNNYVKRIVPSNLLYIGSGMGDCKFVY